MFKIPGQNKKYSITNKSDVGGNIYYTKNIDFRDEGYLKLADAAISVYDGSLDSDFDLAPVINVGDQDALILSDNTFRSPSTVDLQTGLTNLSTSDGAPTPGLDEDATYYNGNWVVSDTNTVEYENGGTWTSISGTNVGDTSRPNVLERFPYQSALLVANGNKVNLVNTSWTVVTTLTLPEGYFVLSMEAVGSYVYIGTQTTSGDSGALFRWDGSSTSHNGIFEVDAYGIVSVKRYQSSVACLTTSGQLLFFNGSSFQELSSFPQYPKGRLPNDSDSEYNGFNHRGMISDGKYIYISFGDDFRSNEFTTLQNQPNGIWCYQPDVGLYHLYSASRTNFKYLLISTSNTNTTTNILTASSGDVPETGTPIFAKIDFSMEVNGNSVRQRWFYVIKLSSTEFQIARTYEDSIEGNELNITTATTSNVWFEVPQIRDYGSTHFDDDIGLNILNDLQNEAETLGRIIFTTQIRNNNDVEEYHLCGTTNKIKNHGYFVTPKLYSSESEDVFNRITLKYKKLSKDDEIVVKYKAEDKAYLPSKLPIQFGINEDVTWTDQSTFTTVLDLQDAEVGDEVEIIGGAGAGITSHISSISKSQETYTVTLEDTIDLISTNDISQVYVDNFKKLGTITKDHPERYKSFTLNKKSEWIQVKVELKGRGITIEELIVDNKTDKPI